TDIGAGDGLLDLDTPKPHLPDLVTHRTSATQLTVENVRHHDQLMQGKEPDGNDPKVAKTGILKGGKLWKNGDSKKVKPKVEVEEVEEPRRSVRFSGRDEYSMLENLPLDKIPLDAANSAALARFMPKLRELGMLLGEPRDNWHVELSPIEPEAESSMAGPDQPPLEEEKQPPPQMDDEQISESMQRYEEMRRRIAAAEGRDNTSVCSDESKSSSDSQSSDSTMTETRIRRLENSDMAHVAGGVMRSNSEVRRAIERNALRRSLTRFSDARKKDTNKNERNERGETSILEKLRWLTATEDATNGNTDQEDGGNENDENDPDGQTIKKEIDPKVQETIAQYRKLAEMFNRTTSLRTTEILVPGDVREWKLQSDLFSDQKGPSVESEPEEIPESHSGSTTPTVYQAVPVASIADLVTDDDCDKLIYSGGVRYTREGTLPSAVEGDENEELEGEQQQSSSGNMQTAEARKQFLSQMSGHSGINMINGLATHSRDRSSLASNSDSYSYDDIDEALHDDRSSSVPSSSQSSPRLSGRSDLDGTSTTESGYSSNETNGELCPVSSAQLLEIPPGGVDVDELAEFVRQDAGRMERLRRRYDANEQEEYGFNRRPSVRGIKPRYGSTTDLLKQMATQLAPPTMAQPGMAGSHMTWPYREVGDDDSAPPTRRRAAPNRAVLPALQEDSLYIPTSDLSPQTATPPPTSTATATSLTHTKAPRVVHVYSSTGDLRAPPPPRLQGPRESPPPDLIRPGAGPVPSRPHSHISMSQAPLHGSVQSLVMAPQMPTPMTLEHHHPACRRPASVHGHLPPDTLVTRGVPPPPGARPHSTLQHYPPPRVPIHYHPYEEPPMPRSQYEGGHPPLAQRGSYPGTLPATASTPHYQPVIPNDPNRYPNPPPYGSHPHVHPPIVSPREGAPYTRTAHPQIHSAPQGSPMAPGPAQVHQCGPRHPSQPRIIGGTISEPACSPVWSHQLLPQGSVHQAYPPHPVSSHLSYTTPIVPESGIPARPSGLSVGPSIGPPLGPPLINGTVGKLDGLRDERGVPEGASSSPRGPSDPQYTPSHASPTRDPAILHRHPPPMNMT
ncbi:hypothetical protein SK128_027534, partial [Halocaridina rubra]